jgi:hypothetical protein
MSRAYTITGDEVHLLPTYIADVKKRYRYDNGKRMLHTNTNAGYRPPVLGVPSTKNFVPLSKIELSLIKALFVPKIQY